MVTRRQSTITLWNVVSNSASPGMIHLLYPNKLKWNISIIANHDNTSLGNIKLKILCHRFKVQSYIQSCAVKTLVTNSSVSKQLTKDQSETSSPNFFFFFINQDLLLDSFLAASCKHQNIIILFNLTWVSVDLEHVLYRLWMFQC